MSKLQVHTVDESATLELSSRANSLALLKEKALQLKEAKRKLPPSAPQFAVDALVDAETKVNMYIGKLRDEIDAILDDCIRVSQEVDENG